MDDEHLSSDPPFGPDGPEALRPDMTTEAAFRLLVALCCAEVDVQVAQFLERDEPAGAHKSRVALRRLTTVLDAFRPVLRRKAHAAERAKAKAIFREMGKVREADVYLELRQTEAPPKARARARLLRDALRRKLRKERMVGFPPALLAKVAEGSILRSGTGGMAERGRPLHQTAGAAVEAWWRACLAFPEDLARLSEEDRHELRKALKGLRYAAEFFAPVWNAPGWPAMRDLLRDVQDDLGRLNDLAVARRLDGITDRRAEAEALLRASDTWAALRAAPRWWVDPAAAE